MACIVMQALIVVSNLFSSYLPRRMILNLPCCERSTTVEAILLSPSTSAYFGPPSILPQSSTRSLLEGSTQRFNKRDCRGPKQSWTCKITFAVTLMKLSAEVLPELSPMERQQKKIIVDGALDVGKSTLSRNMCKDWGSEEIAAAVVPSGNLKSIREATSIWRPQLLCWWCRSETTGCSTPI